MWVDGRGHWHIINHAFDVRQFVHCGNSTLSAHRFSIDGRTWHILDPPVELYGHTVHYDDGSEHTYTTLERPFVVFNEAGEATHLSLAADMDTGDEGCADNQTDSPYRSCTNCKYRDRMSTIIVRLKMDDTSMAELRLGTRTLKASTGGLGLALADGGLVVLAQAAPAQVALAYFRSGGASLGGCTFCDS